MCSNSRLVIAPGATVGARNTRTHILWERDYGEVSPLRGVRLGDAQHALSVGVSVLPLNVSA